MPHRLPLPHLPLLLCAVAVWCAFCPGARAQQIPPVPAGHRFTYDAANLFDAATLRQISAIQREAFEDSRTPIVLVTIPSMAQHGWQGEIEPFATAWFDVWKIGSRENNRGILLLISVGDRKARIELGADWGRRWDGYTKSIMDDRIVYNFKLGSFGAGALAGMQGLRDMARLDPASEPPRQAIVEQIGDAWRNNLPPTPITPFGARVAYPLVAAGLLLLVLAIFFPGIRKFLLWVAALLIFGSLAFWAFFFVLVLLQRGNRSSGYGSSGGFGGGFSGGGGSTGSW